ncbi:hypothetical protein KEM60_00666 [Austwickia sp. TVS 96-490-7B]|nr:hypothetical protein [Austwickia sp. TVS 96-490-7B]
MSVRRSAQRWGPGGRRIAGAVIVAVIWAGTSGCGRDENVVVDPATEAALLSISTIPSELAQAEQRVTADCLRDHGFSAVESFEVPGGDSANLAGIVGLRDVEVARTEGYAEIAVRHDAAPATTGESPTDSAYETAFAGRPGHDVTIELSGGTTIGAADEGCLAEGRKKIYGSVKTYLWITNISQDIRTAVGDIRTSPRMMAANVSYLTCMTHKGVSTTGLSNTLDIAREKFASSRAAHEPPGAEEISMAIADAECQQSAELAKVANEAIVHQGAQWIQDHEKQILDIAAARKEALARAKSTLNRT